MAEQAGPLWALGAMSGTSLDGVDAAMVLTDGVAIHDFGPLAYRPYSAAEQAVLQCGRGLWQGDAGVEDVAHVVEAAHIALLSRFTGVDVVGFHGQTLAHDPANGRTHQAGDGARLAVALGVKTVWDFRSNDVALGGQGAPLVPFFHHACAVWAGLRAPVAFLNLGGVGNVTWVDPRVAGAEQAGAVLAFDTGPANAPINDLMLARRGAVRDDGGALALSGQVDDGVVERFLVHPYFHKMPPKSLDRDSFAMLQSAVADLSDADAAATLAACAAASVAKGAEHFPTPIRAIYVCGGGRHNAAIMAELRKRLGLPVEPVESIGLNGDMLEAQAFAFLAVRVLRGLPTSGPSTTGVAALVGGGQVSG